MVVNYLLQNFAGEFGDSCNFVTKNTRVHIARRVYSEHFERPMTQSGFRDRVWFEGDQKNLTRHGRHY
jgi:hypothetical protein